MAFHNALIAAESKKLTRIKRRQSYLTVNAVSLSLWLRAAGLKNHTVCFGTKFYRYVLGGWLGKSCLDEEKKALA